jgi:hypothetical protein
MIYVKATPEYCDELGGHSSHIWFYGKEEDIVKINKAEDYWEDEYESDSMMYDFLAFHNFIPVSETFFYKP